MDLGQPSALNGNVLIWVERRLTCSLLGCCEDWNKVNVWTPFCPTPYCPLPCSIVVFVCCSPDIFRQLMVVFRKAGLPQEEFVFFYIDVFGHSLNSQYARPWARDDKDDAIAKEAFQVGSPHMRKWHIMYTNGICLYRVFRQCSIFVNSSF